MSKVKPMMIDATFSMKIGVRLKVLDENRNNARDHAEHRSNSLRGGG